MLYADLILTICFWHNQSSWQTNDSYELVKYYLITMGLVLVFSCTCNENCLDNVFYILITVALYIQGTSDGWVESCTPIKGIKWARSAETVTHGIGVWNRPFVLQRTSGTIVSLWVSPLYPSHTYYHVSQFDEQPIFISFLLSTIDLRFMPKSTRRSMNVTHFGLKIILSILQFKPEMYMVLMMAPRKLQPSMMLWNMVRCYLFNAICNTSPYHKLKWNE